MNRTTTKKGDNTILMQTLDQIKQERIKKRDTLISQGKNPYPAFNKPIITITKARDLMDQKAQIAGRVISLRGHGKLVFADLKDEAGKIQLMFKADILDEKLLNNLKLVDMGDFLYVEGTVGKSMRGEISVLVENFEIITKSIRPLPEKWHGLKDIEERYRQRYVDLLVNEGVKDIFLTRTKIISLLRKFLNDHKFIEVETPVLQPLYGGASAKPFITHHNALDIDLYLRISDELYLKRLVVAGFEKVFEIGHDFRNEGLSRAHNPEFTMLEFYWAYVDYKNLMNFTENMFEYVIQEIKGNLKINFQGKEYDFKTPWTRITYHDLFKQYLNIDINEINDEKKLADLVEEKKLLGHEKTIGFAQILDKLYKKHIRPKLEGPLFITDHPVEMRPLAKKKDTTHAASFQLLIAGEEFINAYNELNDPEDQRKRWEEEMALAKKGAEDYQLLDEDYIRALEYGMPPTAGWGLGIDRLVALLTDQHSLKDVILFPTLRPENSNHATPSNLETAQKYLSKDVIPRSMRDPESTGFRVKHGMTKPSSITRQKALEILNKNLTNKNLVKHNMAVEAAMRALGLHFKEDENKWAIVGLLHDADWEATKNTPQLHTKKTYEWLKEAHETDEAILHAILSHNYVHTGKVAPSNNMEWSLYCCDELTGLIIASALVLPDKKLASLTVQSVLKKFPSKHFAAGVDREQIKMCEEKLGIKLEDFVEMTLKSMQGISQDLGL